MPPRGNRKLDPKGRGHAARLGFQAPFPRRAPCLALVTDRPRKRIPSPLRVASGGLQESPEAIYDHHGKRNPEDQNEDPFFLHAICNNRKNPGNKPESACFRCSTLRLAMGQRVSGAVGNCHWLFPRSASGTTILKTPAPRGTMWTNLTRHSKPLQTSRFTRRNRSSSGDTSITRTQVCPIHEAWKNVPVPIGSSPPATNTFTRFFVGS